MKFIKFLFCLSATTLLFSSITFGKTKISNNEWIEKSLPLTISEETNKEYILVNTITGEEITDVYETINGITKKLNAEEALDKLNKIQTSELNENLNNNNNIENYEAGYTESYFEKTNGPNKVTGNPEKISYDVKGPASIQISQGQQVTFNESFSSDVTYSMKATIRLGAGIQWSKSATRSVSVTHQVPSGRIGYVSFKPYYYEVKGNYITKVPGTIISSKKVTARTPITLSNGICDGLEYVVLK